MMHLKNIAIALSFIVAILPAKRNAGTDGNDIALPSELYMLPKSSNNLFSQSYIRRWNPYEYYVRVNGDCFFERRLPEVSTVVNPKDECHINIDLIRSADFDTLASKSILVHVRNRPIGTRNVTAQIIGDSFVQGAFYRTALVDSMYVPGLTTIGLRKLARSENHYDEGRGGWTLKDYFSISKDEFSPYSGFMQPSDACRYLGACRFWINCHKVNKGELNDFESRYQCGRFEECCMRFDSETGLPVHPQKDDLMWDNDRKCYIRYNGEKWERATDIHEEEWSFNYPKYLAIWNLRAPDFLFETLGLNDFRDELNPDYAEWDRLLTLMKESYLEANPKGKFAIVIPCSSCGSLNNKRGDFTIRQNACMWQFRKHLIDTFDNRRQEGFYIVDMGITIDNENGYKVDADGLQTGNPHPYLNYPTMGMPLAAFIQYHRK